MVDTTEDIRHMKIEATWILTNLAYGTDDDLQIIFDGRYGLLNYLNTIMAGSD